MAGDQFGVRTAVLRTAAGNLGERAGEAGDIAGKAGEADVAEHSWGLLGLGLGLYAWYSSARDTADSSIGKVQSFLTDAQYAVDASADLYDQADRSGSTLFQSIGEVVS